MTDELSNQLRESAAGFDRGYQPGELMRQAAAKIETMRVALAWYAEPVLTYNITQVAEPRSAVHADGGRRAREALVK